MRLKTRSYPRPVLGNSDDFPNQEFTTKIQLQLKNGPPRYYKVSCEFKCDNEFLVELIKKNKVEYAIHVETGASWFRQEFCTNEQKFSFSLNVDDIAEYISVNAFILSKEEFEYKPKNAHADYGDRSFVLNRSDILGQDSQGTKTFYIDDFDGGTISSWLKIDRSDNSDQESIKFHETKEYLWVILPQKDFDDWNECQKISRMADEHIVSPAFVLPAVIHAISCIKKDSSLYDPEHGSCWARALYHQIRNKKIEIDNVEITDLAQEILEMPVGRVCRHAKIVLGTQEEEE